jgi:hypothetical protein
VKVTQLTLFLENRSGRLAEVADLLPGRHLLEKAKGRDNGRFA